MPKANGYILAAEIGAVALAAELLAAHALTSPVILEIDNPQVPRVLLKHAKLPQSGRIPSEVAAHAAAFLRSDRVTLRILRRNATPGLRRADSLAHRRLLRR